MFPKRKKQFFLRFVKTFQKILYSKNIHSIFTKLTGFIWRRSFPNVVFTKGSFTCCANHFKELKNCLFFHYDSPPSYDLGNSPSPCFIKIFTFNVEWTHPNSKNGEGGGKVSKIYSAYFSTQPLPAREARGGGLGLNQISAYTLHIQDWVWCSQNFLEQFYSDNFNFYRFPKRTNLFNFVKLAWGKKQVWNSVFVIKTCLKKLSSGIFVPFIEKGRKFRLQVTFLVTFCQKFAGY